MNNAELDSMQLENQARKKPYLFFWPPYKAPYTENDKMLDLTVVWINPQDNTPRNYGSIASAMAVPYFHNLIFQIVTWTMKLRSGNNMYTTCSLEYHDIYRVNAENAEHMLGTLKRVSKYLANQSCPDVLTTLKHTAKALGIHGMIMSERPGRTYSGGEYTILNCDEMIVFLSGIIAEMQATV